MSELKQIICPKCESIDVKRIATIYGFDIDNKARVTGNKYKCNNCPTEFDVPS